MAVLGFLVYVDCREEIDEVDIRRAIVNTFSNDPTYADVTRVEVGALGPVSIDKELDEQA